MKNKKAKSRIIKKDQKLKKKLGIQNQISVCKKNNIKVMKNLFWDMKLSQSEIQILMDQNDLKNPLTASLYARILSSVSWYKILEQLSEKQLHSALSDEVIRRIKSKCLRDRFRYARNMLFDNRVVNR